MTKEGPARQLSSLGITQVELAERLGVTKAAVARGIHRGNSRYLALIDALVLLTPEQRNVWLKTLPSIRVKLFNWGITLYYGG